MPIMDYRMNFFNLRLESGLIAMSAVDLLTQPFSTFPSQFPDRIFKERLNMKSSVKIFHVFAALISGIILCNAFVYFEGYLAAIAIPREYFASFGKANIRSALFVLDISTFALPYCVMGLIWGVPTSLVLRTRLLSASLWCGLGSLLAMVYLMFFDGASASIYMMVLNDPYMLGQFLVNTMAGPCGVVVGGYFLYRFRPKQPETFAETS